MTEPREPSYYEIALTNRQVLVAFVLLLGCVVAAFFAGVWVGRGGEAEPAEALAAQSGGTEAGDAEPGELEEFNFFTEEEPGPAPQEEAAPAPQEPSLETLAREPRAETTLSEDLGIQAGGRGEPGEGPEAAAEEAPPPRPAPPPEERPAASEPEPGEAQGPVVIQVFSSPDGEQARRIMERLRAGGYRAFLSPVDVAGSTMHRVRIGPYEDRGEAQSAAAEIRKAFRLDTWITAGG